MSQSKKVSLVAAAVAASLGSSAYALPPAAFTDGTIFASNFYYAAGDSAEVQAVFTAVRSALAPNSVDVYTDAAVTTPNPQSVNYLVISGTASVGNIAFFYKYNSGGFVDGVLPQIGSGSNLLYPPPADLADATEILPSPVANTSVTPNWRYSSAHATVSKLPDWGITDQEAALFNFKNNLNGSPKQNLNAGLKGTPGWVTPFGIAVTVNLRAGAHPKTQFTKSEVAGILKAAISDWSQVYADDGTPLAAGPIYLLDCVSGSGTKTAGNQFFLNYPGGLASGGATDPNSVVGNNVNSYNGGTTLNTNATGFQDVKEASSVAIVNDLQLAQSRGKRALAVLSLEFPPHQHQLASGTNDYFFVGIDGIFVDSNSGTTDNINSASGGTTKYTNIITGNYEFAYQVGINSRNGFTQPTFQTEVLNFLKSETLSGAHTGTLFQTAFPVAARGVLLDPRTTNQHDAGNLTWSRGAVSTAVPVIKNDAAVNNGPINFGPGDPVN